MTHWDEDAEHFYARLAARTEAEDYCPVELVIALPNGRSAAADELYALEREMLEAPRAVTHGEGGKR